MSSHILKTTRENIDPIVVDWGKEVSFGLTTKVFVAHLLHSKKDGTFPRVLQFHGNHLNYIEVIGVVVREKRREEQYYFTIDDGTGLLDCRVHNKVLWECMRIGENESLIQKCIRVIGPVEYSEFSCLGQTVDGEGSLCAAQLNVQTISECIDANEEYIHWMEVVRRDHHLYGVFQYSFPQSVEE